MFSNVDCYLKSFICKLFSCLTHPSGTDHNQEAHKTIIPKRKSRSQCGFALFWERNTERKFFKDIQDTSDLPGNLPISSFKCFLMKADFVHIQSDVVVVSQLKKLSVYLKEHTSC